MTAGRTATGKAADGVGADRREATLAVWPKHLGALVDVNALFSGISGEPGRTRALEVAQRVAAN